MGRHSDADSRDLRQCRDAATLSTGTGDTDSRRHHLVGSIDQDARCGTDDHQLGHDRCRDCRTHLSELCVNTIMSGLELFILIAIIAYIAFKTGVHFASNAAASIMEKLGVTEEELRRAGIELGIEEEDPEELPADTIEFKIEKHGEILYAYNLHTEAFIAQSKTAQGMIDRMLEIYPPGTKFHINYEDGADYIREVAGVEDA